MIQKYSIWKVLRVFFDDPNPREGFTIRWISKTIGLTPPSVKLHLNELSRKDLYGYPLVIKSKGRSYPTYWANRASDLFRFYKKMDVIFRLEECNLLQYLSEQCSPESIVLFGSASRGEDLSGSDIDLFVQSDEKELSLGKYEKILKRKLSLYFTPDFRKFPPELRNNILNGIILRGYLKVF